MFIGQVKNMQVYDIPYVRRYQFEGESTELRFKVNWNIHAFNIVYRN